MTRAIASLILLLAAATAGHAQTAERYEALIQGAELSDGPVRIYAAEDAHYISLPPEALGRTLIWSAEVARYPADATVSFGGTEIATRAVGLERRGGKVLVRSLSSGSIRTTDDPVAGDPALKMSPIDIAISNVQIGPVVLAFDILAEDEEGRMLLDATAAFTSDIPDYSVKGALAASGLTPVAVDPARSYIVRATAHPSNVFLVSHLTFLAQDASGLDRALSVEVAHTITLLPEDPMEVRPADPRVGYFVAELLEFEGADGTVSGTRRHALRHRLVHADPDAPRPSPPAEPLVYYLSPEIPERWRPAIRAAVEDWQPAFEAAGFTEAIVARDAPSPEEDPDWSVNDARLNVIRWIAQPVANALGPNVHDPRTGEILSAHILVWPEVLNVFSDYYYLLMSELDPRARALPLPEEVQARILRYAVSHEVGHTLGLRHNHRASTAWTIEQLRDPAFTAENGSTASIMAYGRFNYVARPGDGVEELFPLIGPYDAHAIEWGYAPGLSAAELNEIASEAHAHPELVWGAGELPEEVLGRYDPGIQRENIGADRIEATRAGLGAISAALARLPAAVPPSTGREATMARVYDQARMRYLGFTGSVAQMVGGFESTASDGAPAVPVPVEAQRAALIFLMGEAIDALGVFADPELLAEFRPVGGIEGVDALAQAVVASALDPLTVRRVYTQDQLDPSRGFGVAEMLSVVTDAMLAGGIRVEEMSPPRRAALARYVTMLQGLPLYAGDPSVAVYEEYGFPQGFVLMAGADLSDTGISDAASAELERLVAALAPREDGLATRLFKDVERMLGVDPEAGAAGEAQADR